MTSFLIVDGSSLIHRAFYAMPLLNNAAGQPTNAVYGLATMLTKVLERENPDFVAICFDKSRKTFRTEKFADYKGQRKETPPELKAQFEPAKELVNALGLVWEEIEGYEGDDIIGTLAQMGAANGIDVIVLTGDRDALQLIGDHVKIHMTQKGISDVKIWDKAALEEHYHLKPAQVIDFKGLMGDSSDNIPGVPGVGEKTALKLLAQYPTMEEIYQHLDEVKPAGLQKKLADNRELAFLSKELATIDCCVPGLKPLADYRRRPAGEELKDFYRKMNFQSLLRQLVQPEKVVLDSNNTADVSNGPWPEKKNSFSDTPCHLLETTTDAAACAARLQEAGQFSFWLDIQGAPYDGNIQACGFALPNGECFGLELMGILDIARIQPFAAVFSDVALAKTTFCAKEAQVALAAFGISLQGVRDDGVLAAYLLDPTANHYVLEDLAATYLQVESLWPTGIPLGQQAARKASYLQPLCCALSEALKEAGMYELYQKIELPLTAILAEMELCGIKVDGSRLQEMAQELQKVEQQLTAEIYDLAGHEFNLNSPKQLGGVLFDELHIPPVKKTKTGYSTDAEVLEQLAAEYDIAKLILEYRTYFKLRTTYAQGLPALIRADGKIHTSFNQTVTATGRLSSAEPNLQNIPVRDELGRKIRMAFVPEKAGNLLLAVDYSQIELRVLAHITGDEGLCQSFLEGEDIHTRTAAEVFGVPLTEVTKEQRRRAKAVNFGIIYGISDFGLARDLGIPRWEAKDYITLYLARYPKVAAYMRDIVAQGKQDGYVSTLLGRRRYLPELNSRNGNIRHFAERMALNTPIQGTAADILKIAMVHLAPRLKQENFQAKLLLQVHDELIFDLPEAEIPALVPLLQEVMSHPIELAVPLEVEVKVGADWYSMHKYER